MKSQRLFDAIEHIEDKYIIIENTKTKTFPLKWLAIAACFLIVCAIGGASMLKAPPEAFVPAENLPLISLDNGFLNDGMGFEGYMAKDISELVNDNPWTKSTQLQYLPVYRNALYNLKEDTAYRPDLDKLTNEIILIAKRLGIYSENVSVKSDYPDEATIKAVEEKYAATGEKPPLEFYSASSVSLKTDTMTLTNDGKYIQIDFTPPVALPSEYNWGHFAAYNDVKSVADYLKTQYKALINMPSAKANIYGGDRNIYSQQMYSIEFFNNEGSAVDKIINYNFNRTAFYCDDNNALFIARVFSPDLSNKLGDYPVITPKQAEDLLCNGNYITTVPQQFSSKERIKKVELIYRNNAYDKIYMPYYRFYVELDDAPMPEDVNLKTYGAYYVPAIDGRYIENMPVWDGSFN